MREIKFRAWVCQNYDKNDKPINFHMVQWHQDFFADTSEVTHYSDEFPDGEYTILMQYTGLKDKNGKEIYESDILDLGTEDKSIFEVVFEKGCWRKKYKDWDSTIPNLPFDEWDLQNFRVIGNIYENPELLKEHAK